MSWRLGIFRGPTLFDDPLSCARSKHLDMCHYFVPKLLRAKEIDVQFEAPEEQHSDIWTKSLAATLSKSHRMFLLNLLLEGE